MTECNFDTNPPKTTLNVDDSFVLRWNQKQPSGGITIKTIDGDIRIDSVNDAHHLERIIKEHGEYKTRLAELEERIEKAYVMLSYYSVDNCDKTKIPYAVAEHLELIQETLYTAIKHMRSD